MCCDGKYRLLLLSNDKSIIKNLNKRVGKPFVICNELTTSNWKMIIEMKVAGTLHTT